VASVVLDQERRTLGTGAAPGAAPVLPGRRSGNLGRRAGDVAAGAAGSAAIDVDRATFAALVSLAENLGCRRSPTIRQGLARLFCLLEVNRMAGERSRAGAVTDAEANLAKLRVAELFRLARDVGTQIAGPWGTVMTGDMPDRELVPRLTLFSPAPAIYGGTDQIQRNIVAERALGLPKEPLS
jgi:alkylation response protein AidB-like acyl-CoA dehydrogenase